MYNPDMTKKVNTSFGSNLKAARNAAGYTQQAAADAFDISLRGYCRWESGQTEPSIGTIVDICKLFMVSADQLLGLSDAGPVDG